MLKRKLIVNFLMKILGTLNFQSNFSDSEPKNGKKKEKVKNVRLKIKTNLQNC